MKNSTYHIGLLKKSEETVVLQLRRSVDFLSPEIWKYYGERINTKANIKRNKNTFLCAINAHYGTNFKHILID